MVTPSFRPESPRADVSAGERADGDVAPSDTLGVQQHARQKAAAGFAVELARLIHDLHCTDVVVLDVRGLSQVTDFLVIGSGTSDRQMHSTLDHSLELGRERGFEALRTSIDARSVWLVADFVDVVLHLFEPQTRAYYDLEMLWGDAPRLEWERPEQRSRNLAGLSPDDVIRGV